MEEKEVRDALQHITNVDDYDTWLHVGMALKDGGYPLELWEEWSRQGTKYKDGDCEVKWNSFNNDGFHIDSVFWLAKQNGYMYSVPSSHGSMWDYQIPDIPDETEVINKDGSMPLKRISTPDVEQVKEYLTALYDRDDIVGYCTNVKKGKDRYILGKGTYDRTAGEILDLLNTTGDIEKSIGQYNHDAGVYIRVNSLDGSGESDSNVKKFRYTLIESDTQSIERQNYLMHEFKLPIKALVYSGGKSIHATVNIDAKNKDEYRDRVRWMHQILNKWGLEVDAQDKNPSRYTRLPGIDRGNKKQYLIETNIGMHSFEEWKKYVEEMEDGLPDPVPMDTVWNSIPPLAPVLIDGVLRQGHKMILSATSKSGKSFALIELAYAIAEGMNWLGHRCTQGKVMYINMEIDEPSFMNRVKAVYDAYGMDTGIHSENFVEWTLRGYGRTLSKLVQPIIRRLKGNGYIAVIIDPLYKVLEGDENSNSDIARLVSYFDKIARETGCAVIYAHHYAKGFMGDRSSIDRGAGAGTFSRDPDAIVTMTQLDWSDPDDSDHKGLQVEYTLREFHGIESQKIFWKYPIHRIDTDGVLDDVDLVTSSTQKQKMAENAKERRMSKEYDDVCETVERISTYKGGFLVSDFIKEYKKQNRSKNTIAINTAKDLLKRCGYCQTNESIGSAKIWSISDD